MAKSFLTPFKVGDVLKALTPGWGEGRWEVIEVPDDKTFFRTVTISHDGKEKFWNVQSKFSDQYVIDVAEMNRRRLKKELGL